MQKVIHRDNKQDFDVDLSYHLEEGWTVVPQTYQVQSAARTREPWEGDNKTFYKTTYFVVLEQK